MKIGKKEKIILAIVTIIAVVGIFAGVSYAYWSYTATQGTANKITSDCLKISIEDVTDAIDLQKAYPITDEQAAKLTPYTFKITNSCSYTESYSVNLEVMDVTSRLSSDFVAVSFNGGSKNILSSLTEATPTYKKDDYTAIEAYNLTSGRLDGGASTTYTISLWMDESVTVEDDAMNKNFVSKISVTAEIIPTLCRRARTLHTETCDRAGTYYCSGVGYTQGGTIAYGNETVTEGVLTTGDAFDCDVNRDGTYDAETERFYYVSDYYDTATKSFNSNYATLIYYSNVSGGMPSNSATYAYDSSEINNNGPVTAISQLPIATRWNNVSLITSKRAILSHINGTTTTAGTLPTAFSYEGYAARLLTYQEIKNGCYDGTTSITTNRGLLNKCEFLLENTNYSSTTAYGYWTETADSARSTHAWAVLGDSQYVYMRNVTVETVGVRPVIEVAKSEINY